MFAKTRRKCIPVGSGRSIPATHGLGKHACLPTFSVTDNWEHLSSLLRKVLLANGRLIAFLSYCGGKST